MMSLRRNPSNARQVAVGLALALALLAGGCQAPAPTAAPAAGPAAAGTDLAAVEDACAARLHDLAGLMLQYHLAHGHLPPTREELAAMLGPDGVGLLTCPVTHRPYAYAPAGLEALGTTRRLVLFDDAPAHNGKAWALTLAPPAGNQPLSLFVVALSKDALAAYRTP